MNISPIILCFIGFLLYYGVVGDISFDQNYNVTWGQNHAFLHHLGTEIQLVMDPSSGAGFVSKLSYGSGLFDMSIKIPNRNTAGVVTAFYLSSSGGQHAEMDFEFLGNVEGKPVTLQTNVFSNGEGNREQRIHLWFDPSLDFHTYQILWNEHQIAFFVDNTPIRVFNNNTRIGVSYPSKPMQVIASLWNGEDWATDGGQTKTNWTYAPFNAYYRGFDINGCPITQQNPDIRGCYSSNYWWNTQSYWKLNVEQEQKYAVVKKNYMNYDYCTDRDRHPVVPTECY